MSPEFAVVPADAVRRILDPGRRTVIDLIEKAYVLHGKGDTVNPPSYFLRFPDRPEARIIALPAVVDGGVDVAGLKWISSFPSNLEKALPRASAVLVLNDRDTGFPFACLEASLISAARTAASAALATVHLRRGNTQPVRAGFIGTGPIARAVVDYLLAAGVVIGELRAHDRDAARAARFAEETAQAAGLARGRTAQDPEEVIRGSDLVVFATSAGSPHITDRSWFDHHPLVLNLSLRDLSPEIVLDSVNVLDDVDHCLKAGTSPHLAEQRAGNRDFVHATLPEVIDGGWFAPPDRTVIFSPFGLGVLDLVLAQFVHERAAAEGAAVTVTGFFAGLGPDGRPDSRSTPGSTLSGRLDPLPISADEAAAAVARSLRRDRLIDTAETAVGQLVRNARRTPDRTVVVHGDAGISWAGLAREVFAVRRALVAHGCAHGEVVACLGPRSPKTVAIFLALESLGAVYLPLDAGWPAVRLEQILRGSGSARVIDYLAPGSAAGEALATAAGAAGVPVLAASGDVASASPEDLATVLAEIDRPRCADSSEPRYLYYTSGSTGVPKGALVEHRGMVNHLHAKITDLGLGGGDRLGFTAPLVFDIAICQMLMPILVGGTGVVVDDLTMRIPRKLVAELGRRRVTVLEVVPTVVGWIADEVERNSAAALPDLRWLVSTGEELRPPLAARVAEVMPGARLLNSYGFTETSDDVAHHEVLPRDLGGARLPVGSAVINSVLYVLVDEADGTWRAAAPGEAGELFVGGLPVGRGYPGNPEATRAAYFTDVLDPASPTGRLYRTGDAAMIQDGVLYCLGRLDRQTKIAGVRVEPDEVEAALLRHPSVRQCAVLVRQDGGTAQLVACVVPVDDLPAEELRTHLAALLPPAMVPEIWCSFDALPLNTNGKVDHRALREMV